MCMQHAETLKEFKIVVSHSTAVLRKPDNSYLLKVERELSIGQCFPPFEQPGLG